MSLDYKAVFIKTTEFTQSTKFTDNYGDLDSVLQHVNNGLGSLGNKRHTADLYSSMVNI